MRLWKLVVDLEDEKDARIMLSRAVIMLSNKCGGENSNHKAPIRTAIESTFCEVFLDFERLDIN